MQTFKSCSSIFLFCSQYAILASKNGFLFTQKFIENDKVFSLLSLACLIFPLSLLVNCFGYCVLYYFLSEAFTPELKSIDIFLDLCLKVAFHRFSLE